MVPFPVEKNRKGSLSAEGLAWQAGRGAATAAREVRGGEVRGERRKRQGRRDGSNEHLRPAHGDCL